MEQFESVQLIADEQPRLMRELRDLPADAWTAPSRCAGWSNAWVAAHLALGTEMYRDCVTRALNGDCAPPVGPDGQPLRLEEFRSRQRSRAEALVQGPTSDLLDRLIRSSQALLDVYLRLVPADRDRPAWHPSGTLTIGAFVAYRVFELGFHGWDIRASVDPEAGIRPEVCPFLLGMMRQLQPRFCHPDADLAGVCRFEVDGESWTMRIGHGKLEADSRSTVPDAIIRTDSSTLLLLATSRRTLAECMDQVSLDGERPRAAQLLGATCFRV